MERLEIHQGTGEQENLCAATELALKRVSGKASSPKLVIFLCTYNYDSRDYPKALEMVKREFKHVPVIGGSAEGFFTNEFCVSCFSAQVKNRGAAIFVFDSADIEIGVGVARDVDKDPLGAGRRATLDALAKLECDIRGTYDKILPNLALKELVQYRPVNGFLISGGITDKHGFLENELLSGVRSVIGNSIRIAGGGLSGGILPDGKWTPTTTFVDQEICYETALLVLFSGPYKIGYGVGNGYKPVAGTGVWITKADNWTVQEVDGKPAAKVLRELFLKHAKIPEEEFNANTIVSLLGSSYMLGMREGLEDYYWPCIPFYVQGDEVSFCGKLASGVGLALTKTTKESCIESAQWAARQIKEDSGATSFDSVFFFSCGCRGFYLERSYSEEIRSIKKVLGENTTVAGIDTVAEIGSFRGGLPQTAGIIISMLGFGR